MIVVSTAVSVLTWHDRTHRYTGRDTFHDTPDPFTVPPRVPKAVYQQPPSISVTGTLHVGATARWQEAPAIASTGLQVTQLPTEEAALPPQDEMASHLSSPTGKFKPSRLPPSPALAPLINPPIYPAATEQPGNVQFVPPHEPAFVTFATRRQDNAFRGASATAGLFAEQQPKKSTPITGLAKLSPQKGVLTPPSLTVSGTPATPASGTGR